MRPRTFITDDGRVRRSKIRRSSPCGKQAYSSKKIAAAAAAWSRRETGELIEAYHCKRGCHCWHIGHPPGTREVAA